MTASSSARAMRAPGSGGAVIVTVVSPVVALRSGRDTRHLRPAARRDANHLHLHGPDAEQVAAIIRLQQGAAWPRKKMRKRLPSECSQQDHKPLRADRAGGEADRRSDEASLITPAGNRGGAALGDPWPVRG
jgi:hypothetical protein